MDLRSCLSLRELRTFLKEIVFQEMHRSEQLPFIKIIAYVS
jgi:hypothetical protein